MSAEVITGGAVVTLDGVGSVKPTGNFVATSLLREELNVFLFDHSECMKSSGFASDFYTSFTQGLSFHRPKVGFSTQSHPMKPSNLLRGFKLTVFSRLVQSKKK